MTREEINLEIKSLGYELLRGNAYIKDDWIYILELICNCIVNGVKDYSYELNNTYTRPNCLVCEHAYLKQLYADDENVVICGKTNELVGYYEEAGHHCCDDWEYG